MNVSYIIIIFFVCVFQESYDTAILGEDSSTHPIINPKMWAEVSGHKKTRNIFMDRSLDVRRTMYVPFSDVIGHSKTIVTYEEDIKKVVDKAMTSFVQIQLTSTLEPILSIVRVMSKAPYKVKKKIMEI